MTMREQFWERFNLDELTSQEWEALCDGCGKCCINKLEDKESGDVLFTRVACRLLDGQTCRCMNYAKRLEIVPNCIVLTPDLLEKIAYFMPESCAYRRLYEKRGLPEWHPLITGRAQSTHENGHSIQEQTVSESDIAPSEWEDYVIEESV